MNIGIARGNINKGDIRLFDLVPSVKEEHIEPIKQKPKLPIAKIIIFIAIGFIGFRNRSLNLR